MLATREISRRLNHRQDLVELMLGGARALAGLPYLEGVEATGLGCVKVNLVYNASAGSPALALLDGCASVEKLPADAPAKGLADAACNMAKRCSALPVTENFLWNSIQQSFPQLVVQK